MVGTGLLRRKQNLKTLQVHHTFFVCKFPPRARGRRHCTTSATLKKRKFNFQATFSSRSLLWYIGPRPHVSVFVWKRRFFSSGLAYRKCIFLKSLSRVQIFENTGFSFTCGWTKTQVFEYDDVIHHLPKHYACSVRDVIVFLLFSVFAWTAQNDSNALRVDAHFFWKRRKKSPLSKYPDTCGRGLKLPTCWRLAERITSGHRTRRFRPP